ncbi:MAG: glycosyltransferase family 39 protein [Anaerolineae bacterium]
MRSMWRGLRSKLGRQQGVSRAGMICGLILGAILFLSLLLRLWGSDFGLPAYTLYHPDEHALVDRAAAILWTGDWNLHRFNYPPFYAYVQTLAYAGYFLLGASRGLWSQVPPFTLTQYYHIGRGVTALMGTATILVIYLTGRQIFRRRAGLLAAALLGGAYLHVIHSHYATFDVMVGLLASLTLLFSTLIEARGQARWYLLAGLCAGLAGATKYNGAVVFVLPLVAHVLSSPWGEWGWLDGRLFLAGGGFLLGFLGGNPFALGDLPAFLNGLAQVLHHYGTEQPGFEGRGNWRWYLGVFATSADAPWLAAGLAGLAGLVWREWKKGLLLLVFPLLYYLMISRFVVRFERNALPLLPFLALGGGWLLDSVADRLASLIRRPGQDRPANQAWSHGFAAVSCVALLALPLAADVGLDLALSRVDYRESAGRWVEENVAPGTKIAIEHYAIPFDYDNYHVEDVVRIGDHDLAWYVQEGFEIVIVSDGVWPILLDQPEIYYDRVAAYEAVTGSSTLLAEFVPDPPGLVVAGYPTVAVYHFAPVRIYRLPKGG